MLSSPLATVGHVKRTAAEYLAWEKTQPMKHEFFDGEVLARPIESPRHYALCVGAIIALNGAVNGALRGRSYLGLMADRQIVVGEGACYAYPDVGAVIGEVQLCEGTRDAVANPTILVEVLSQGTERYDRGLKWLSYQRLPSLTDYVLVSQSAVRIEHYRRDAGSRWSYRSFGPGERLALTEGVVLDVDAIFAGVFKLFGD
jgi:Uma2 family endonuclease